MSVSYEEMEAKRQEMIASFKDIASAMTRCVALIEDYARLSPSALTTSAALAAVEHGALAAETLAIAAAGKKPRAKKEKKPKDPNAPKRPPSAYLIFQNDVRENIRKSNPSMPYKEVLSLIAHRWKELSDDQKRVYEAAYDVATNEFRVKEQIYKAGGVVPAASLGLAAPVEDSESSSEEESSDDAEVPPPPPPAPTLSASTPSKKDKKRKKSEDGEGKKKKKNRD